MPERNGLITTVELAAILDQPDLRPPAERAVVGGEDDEVESMRYLNGTREVGEEDEGALEHCDHDWLAALVVGGDLST